MHPAESLASQIFNFQLYPKLSQFYVYCTWFGTKKYSMFFQSRMKLIYFQMLALRSKAYSKNRRTSTHLELCNFVADVWAPSRLRQIKLRCTNQWILFIIKWNFGYFYLYNLPKCGCSHLYLSVADNLYCLFKNLELIVISIAQSSYSSKRGLRFNWFIINSSLRNFSSSY